MISKGHTTINLLITTGTIVASLVSSYFLSQMGQDERINKVSAKTFAEISLDRQRISALEEAVGTIKTDTATIKTDIKSILQAVK